MPDYLPLITAYLSHEIDFDALATGLRERAAANPASLPHILERLDALKTAHPAELPRILKLQQTLRECVAGVTPAAPPEFPEQTVVKGAAAPEHERVETVIAAKSYEESATVIAPAARQATVSDEPPQTPPAAAPLPSSIAQPRAEAGEAQPSAAQKLEPGSVIKNRFILETLLGEGGMGRVFKARDLRKEEAHDRNPYVAIKVLNDSFKDHPQAFIALQREAKKAQTLAHPNIVNVYDFDRDGDRVYMTMEYLEGNSLDRMIRQQAPRPFEKPAALDIVRGICLGLSYAHRRNIIHSDLKPGNVFVTKEGDVKIFDFSIARAVKTSDTGGEKTLFDAGSLGGLTPAYASCEMFEGLEPDVRDDIYALACIAYELLGGKHPFNKVPAVKARDNRMPVEKLPHLSRRQNKTLSAGLAFERAARIASVDLFIEALTSRFSKTQKLSAAALAALLILALISYEPLTQYYRAQRIQSYVSQIESGDSAAIQTTLKALTALPHDLRDEILAAAKEPLIAYYEAQAFTRVNAEYNLLDFTGAYRQLNIAAALYPDSAQISVARVKLQQHEQLLVNELTARLSFHLQQGNLLATPDGDDLLDVLQAAAKIDPRHPLLTDRRITAAYAREVQIAANEWNFDQAKQLLDTAEQVLPGDSAMQALRQTVQSQEQQYLARQASLTGKMDAKSLRRDVEALLAKPFAAADWSRSLKAALSQLDSLLPAGDRWLGDTRQLAALFHLHRAENLRRQGKFGEARSVLQAAEYFAPRLAGLDGEKASLQQAEAAAMQQQKSQAQQQMASDLQRQFLREANNNNVEAAAALLNQLRGVLAQDDPFLRNDAPNSLAAAYARLSVHALQRGDSDSAARWIATGLEVAPQHPELNALKTKLPTKTSDACEPKLAGYGKRTTCHDRVAPDLKGPTLVVVPAPQGGKVFAIGKYEISVSDFQAYCRATQRCPATTDSELPMTQVSLTAIRDYLQWLSTQTGATYRLPTPSEWTHAASATAQPPGKDFNCRVVIGANIVKGNDLVTVRSGEMNSWGLVNYIGNAQELVFDAPDTLLALGGAYQDPLAQCNIAFSRKHDGKPDAFTGFRVLREL